MQVDMSDFVLGGFATIAAYRLTDEDRIEEARQSDGSILWAVRRAGTSCLATDGHWEFEPMPSSRDDDFIQRTRYTSPEAALEAWQRRAN